MDKRLNDTWGYILAAIVSVIALVFIPLLGSNLAVGMNLPTTVAGWFVYVVQKGTGALVNICLLASFKDQARINVRGDANYIHARDLLSKNRPKEYKPRSPAKYNFKVYGVKGTSIMLGSVVGAIGITSAYLTYDFLILISYIFVITFGAIFGFRQMKKDEEYWTTEFLDYAIKESEKHDQTEQ